jgi:hypothetical protein
MSEWPTWEVGVYGFGDFYVEAPTAASARWWTVSKMHEAGYGKSPVELIQRGVTVREVGHTWAAIMGDIHRVKLRRPRPSPTDSAGRG